MYYSGQQVTLSAGLASATVHYEIGGSAAGCTSTLFTAPLAIPAQALTTISAVSCVDGVATGDPITESYLVAPVLTGSLDTPGVGLGVGLSGTVAYFADFSGADVRIIDVSNPASPAELATRSPSGNARNISVSGSRLFVATGGTGFFYYDISTPAAPVQIAGAAPGGIVEDVAGVGSTAYLANGFTGDDLSIYDVTAGPALQGGYDANTAQGVFVSDGVAYLAQRGAGVGAIDVTNPLAPALLHSAATTNALGVYVAGDRLYVADGGGGLRIFALALNLLGSDSGAGDARRVFARDGIVYVADGTNGLRIVDATNPAAPALLATYAIAGDTINDVVVAGSYAYIASSDAGLVILQISK